MSEFAEWDSFYLIVGGAAGALIGLQFVVITLIANSPLARSSDTAGAFLTPTIVHFCTTLFLSAMLRAPWPGIVPVAALWGLAGISGIVYVIIVARRVRKQASYEPVFEDTLFHLLLPLIAHALLAVSAVVALSHAGTALFGVGAAALLLLFIGIHNSWDGVAYLVFVNMQGKSSEDDPDGAAPADGGAATSSTATGGEPAPRIAQSTVDGV